MKIPRKKKVNAVKIIDGIFECVFYAGIISLAGLLLFAPIFETNAYYTFLLIAIICAMTPIFYLCIYAEWVSLKKKEVNKDGIQEI